MQPKALLPLALIKKTCYNDSISITQAKDY